MFFLFTRVLFVSCGPSSRRGEKKEHIKNGTMEMNTMAERKGEKSRFPGVSARQIPTFIPTQNGGKAGSFTIVPYENIYIYILKEAPLAAPAASPSDLRWCFWPLLSRLLALPPIDSRPFDGRHRHICWSGRPLANKKETSKSVIFTFPPSSSSSSCHCCSLAWERCVPPPPVYFGKEAPLSPRLLPARPAEA